MADNRIVHYSGQWIFYQGAAAAGAKLYVYLEDTDTLASIYTDRDLGVAADNPMTADANGLMPFAYIGTTAYKVKVTTSAGVTIDEEDDITGALDTSPFSAATFAKPDTDFATKTSDHTVVAGDLGTVLNCNVTGGSLTITLISAVTAGNGRGITIRHIGTANYVKIVTSASQTITRPQTGVTTTAFSLVGYGESVEIVADGANWHVVQHTAPLIAATTGVIVIADRISAAPSSPNPGARYIVTAAYSTFEQEDIIEADGQSGFIEYSPATDCGWLAYVQDEDAYYSFQGSAWVALIRPEIGASLVLVQTQEASASATIDFTTGLDNTYDAYRVVLTSVVAATDGVQFGVRVGTGGSPTYQTTSYSNANFVLAPGAAGAVASVSDRIPLCQNGATAGLGNATGENLSGTLFFANPEATAFCNFEGQTTYNGADGNIRKWITGGYWASTTPITAIRFLLDSGNITSGRFTLYGYKKS